MVACTWALDASVEGGHGFPDVRLGYMADLGPGAANQSDRHDAGIGRCLVTGIGSLGAQ